MVHVNISLFIWVFRYTIRDTLLHICIVICSHCHFSIHPTRSSSLRFSFSEFVRFLVNGSTEFSDDTYVLHHRGLSYHWAPFWRECTLCGGSDTRPQVIIHMETFTEDMKMFLNAIGLGRQGNE